MSIQLISHRLHSCQSLLNAVHVRLEQALLLAHEQNYPQHWIHAIEKAVADNDQSWSHIHNIAILIDLPPTCLPFPKAQAVNHPGP